MTQTTSFIDRVRAEKTELDEKLEKLTAFLASEKVQDITPVQAKLLRKQAVIMTEYSEVLGIRLEDLDKKPADDKLPKKDEEPTTEQQQSQQQGEES